MAVKTLAFRPVANPSRHGRRAVLAAVAFAAAGASRARADDDKPAVETILTVPISGRALPDPPYPWFGIESMTLEPGSVEPYGRAEFHGAGDIGFVVDRGEISFEVDGPALVARTGGNVLANGIPVAAGSVTRLLPGDQAVTGAGVVSRRRNTGTVQAATFELSATDYGDIDSDHDGVSFSDPVALTFPIVFPNGTPARHAVATLVRVVLPPGAQWRWDGLPDSMMLAVVDGPIDLLSGANPLVTSQLGVAPTPSIRMQTQYGMAATSTLFGPSSIFRSGADKTSTMLVATLAPAAS